MHRQMCVYRRSARQSRQLTRYIFYVSGGRGRIHIYECCMRCIIEKAYYKRVPRYIFIENVYLMFSIVAYVWLNFIEIIQPNNYYYSVRGAANGKCVTFSLHMCGAGMQQSSYTNAINMQLWLIVYARHAYTRYFVPNTKCMTSEVNDQRDFIE